MNQSEIDEVFHPERPVTSQNLLFGRDVEVKKTLARLSISGGHVLISGHRGIGKTSIARVAESILRSQTPGAVFGFVSCDSTTRFSYLSEYMLDKAGRRFSTDIINSPARAAEIVAKLIGFLLIDEVDKLKEEQRGLLGEFMKQLSDQSTTFNICLVGIAQTATDIFASHLSVHRCLNEVHVKKLLRPDIVELVHRGFATLQQKVVDQIVVDIAQLSQGFPSNAVVICRHAAESLLNLPAAELGVSQFRRGLQLLQEERGAAPLEVLRRMRSEDDYDSKYWIIRAGGLLEAEEFSDEQLYNETQKLHLVDRASFESFCLGLCLDGVEKIFDMVRPGIYRFTDPRMPMVVSIEDYLRRSA